MSPVKKRQCRPAESKGQGSHLCMQGPGWWRRSTGKAIIELDPEMCTGFMIQTKCGNVDLAETQ